MIDLALAQWVADQLIGLRVATNLFVGWMPDEEHPNDIWVSFTVEDGYPGLVRNVDGHHPYDTIRMMVTARGLPLLGNLESDVMSGRQISQDIYNKLHMLTQDEIAQPAEGDIARLWQVEAETVPFFAGTDTRERPLWVTNYTVQYRSETDHRR